MIRFFCLAARTLGEFCLYGVSSMIISAYSYQSQGDGLRNISHSLLNLSSMLSARS